MHFLFRVPDNPYLHQQQSWNLHTVLQSLSWRLKCSWLNVHVHQWGIMQCCKYPLECKISVHYKSSLKSSEKMHVSAAREVEVDSKSKEHQLFIPQTKWSYCVTQLSSNCFRQMLIKLQRQRFLDGIRRFWCRCGYQLNRTDPKGKSEKIYIGADSNFGSTFK